MKKELFSRLSNVNQFELPALNSILQFEHHPEYEYICKEADQWILAKLNSLDDHEKKKSIVQSRMSLYIPMIHPKGETVKVLLSTKICWAFFILDDVLEAASTHQQATVLTDMACQIAAGTYAGDVYSIHSCLQLYDEVMSEFRSLASASLLERYLKTFSSYVDGAAEEAALRSSNKVPDVKHYQDIRRRTIGMDCVGGILMEFCMGLELSHLVVRSQLFIDFNRAVIDHVWLVNDLLSFRKDYYNKCSHNLLMIMYFQGPLDTSFQQIVYQVCSMIEEKEREILELQTRLVERGQATRNDHLMRYAASYPSTAAGNLRWSYITGRYHGIDNPLLCDELPFHGTWCLHPQLTVIKSS